MIPLLTPVIFRETVPLRRPITVPLLGVGPALLSHVVERGLGKMEPSHAHAHRRVATEGEANGEEFLARPVSLTLLHLK